MIQIVMQNGRITKTHGVVEDRDGERVVAVVVKDEEVAGHDLVLLAEPPPPTGQVRRADALEEDLRCP
jgi:hypothetical protein